MGKSKLPKKPSKLIMVALEDLMKCEDDDDYTISMSWAWHGESCDDAEICSVCLAGAVMAKRL